jgi:glycosyltransferase involved in cell wall biosynthesis
LFLNNFAGKESIDYVYSASDFPADSIPCLCLKLKNPKVIWIAGFYLFACPPWKKNSPYKKSAAIRGFVYWLSQILTYYLIKRFSDFVFVTSEPDKERFITSKRSAKNIIVVKGGVDITKSQKYLKTKSNFIQKRKYLACFVGRLHYQKGILELIDIWEKVVDKLKDSKLAVIGNGVLEKKMIKSIKKKRLEKNIDILGFKDGIEKYKIFKNSKIIVHPAIFDSGGMAAAEGMAWGLPAVSFDLESLKTCYPKGMIKTPCFDINRFAENIIKLSINKKYYKKLSREAIDLIVTEWDWNKRAKDIYAKVFKD